MTYAGTTETWSAGIYITHQLVVSPFSVTEPNRVRQPASVTESLCTHTPVLYEHVTAMVIVGSANITASASASRGVTEGNCGSQELLPFAVKKGPFT